MEFLDPVQTKSGSKASDHPKTSGSGSTTLSITIDIDKEAAEAIDITGCREREAEPNYRTIEVNAVDPAFEKSRVQYKQVDPV